MTVHDADDLLVLEFEPAAGPVEEFGAFYAPVRLVDRRRRDELSPYEWPPIRTWTRTCYCIHLT